jgi:hypothetical protein
MVEAQRRLAAGQDGRRLLGLGRSIFNLLGDVGRLTMPSVATRLAWKQLPTAAPPGSALLYRFQGEDKGRTGSAASVSWTMEAGGVQGRRVVAL